MGMPRTDKAIVFTSIAIDRVADGKIVDHKSEADWLGLLRQLGGRSVGDSIV
jgi:predicted ester cyclase